MGGFWFLVFCFFFVFMLSFVVVVACQRQTKASKVVNAEILMCVNYPQTAKKNGGWKWVLKFFSVWLGVERSEGICICSSDFSHSFIVDFVCFSY